MSAVALQSLLDYLQTALTKSNKQWLAEHLIVPEVKAETPNQKYVRATLTRALRETKRAMAANKKMPNAFDLLNEL